MANWFQPGTTQGVDRQGNNCSVTLVDFDALNRMSLNLDMAGMDAYNTPRFNSLMSNELKTIQESEDSLLIVLESNPSNSYTSSVRQTLKVTKTSQGTEVTVEEKELRLFGKKMTATCIID